MVVETLVQPTGADMSWTCLLLVVVMLLVSYGVVILLDQNKEVIRFVRWFTQEDDNE